MNQKIPDKYSWIDLSDPTYYSALEQIVEGTDNLNIIGNAGSGKSCLLALAYDMLSAQNKNVVVVAPTGIASFNLINKGIPSSTIHSLFKFPPSSIYTSGMLHINHDIEDVLNEIDVLIIDEISFCSNSLFDFIHEVFHLYRSKREKNIPRIILFGDPLQLENPMDRKDPAIKQYFHEVYDDKITYFNSFYFKDMGYKTIILTKIFRIKDLQYQSIFNRIREGTQTNEDLSILNEQVISEEDYFMKHEMYLYLSTTNAGADLVNKSYFDINPNRPRVYETYTTGKVDLSKRKVIHEQVFLKKDCQILCIFNDTNGSYVNGTLAKVSELGNDYVRAIKSNGQEIKVKRHKIQEYEYDYDPTTKQIKLHECGSIDTLGCVLGFSLTFHKTQSLTLEDYYIDMGKGMFANAMLYTAISRASDFKLVGLSRPIVHKDIMTSKEALEFLGKV